MKKLYTIICASALTLFSINANATSHTVEVGDSLANQGNVFYPYQVLNVHVGDIIHFVGASLTVQHNVTDVSHPAGAAAIASGNMLPATGATYDYPVTVAGFYSYHCTFHAGMNGNFNATVGSGITDPTQSLATTAYPTPFTSSLTFNYNGVDKISVFNVLGEQVKSVETGGSLGTIEMNFDEMSSGIYFYRTYKDGAIFETRKIVKSKK